MRSLLTGFRRFQKKKIKRKKNTNPRTRWAIVCFFMPRIHLFSVSPGRTNYKPEGILFFPVITISREIQKRPTNKNAYIPYHSIQCIYCQIPKLHGSTKFLVFLANKINTHSFVFAFVVCVIRDARFCFRVFLFVPRIHIFRFWVTNTLCKYIAVC